MNRKVVLWHGLHFSYYSQMAKDCLKIEMRSKFLRKANYHEMKLQ